MYLRERVAAKLSPRQIAMLERHVDGPTQIELGGPNRVTMKTLVDRGMLKYCTAGGYGLRGGFNAFSRFATLTEYGRKVLACVLALQADALVALGCADPQAPPVTTVPDQPGGDHDDKRVHSEGRGVRDVASVS